MAIGRSAERSIDDGSAVSVRPLDGATIAGRLGLMARPLPLNLLSFFLLAVTSFRHNAPYLFYAFDGRFEATLIGQDTLFMPPMVGFASDFLRGLGNVPFAVNPWFIPEYFLSLTTPGDFTDFPLAYAISATELFVGTYCLGRMLGTPRLAALVAAWILPLLSFQYAGWNLVLGTFRAFPHYALVAALTNAMAALLLWIGRGKSITSSAIPAVLFFMIVTYVVVVAPTLLILAAPPLVLFALVSLLACQDRRQLSIALCTMGGIFAMCVLAGYAHFIAGLVSYTAANEFKDLSLMPSGWDQLSMLFWNPFHPRFFTIERSFVMLGILGAVWAAASGSSVLCLAGIAFLATTVVYFGAGIVHQYHPYWYGPAFWYFEGFLFPFHTVFGALLLSDLIRSVMRLPSRAVQLLRRVGARRATAIGALALAIVPWIYVRHAQKVVGPADLLYFTPYPQSETPITKILKDEIALAPGAPFRGREATLNGRIFPDTISVDITGLSDIPNVLAAHATGNSHSTSGLWQDLIPTLVEYNPLMTPAYFVFMRTFFTEPVDIQVRNIVAMRRIDPRLLAAVGVRFVITDRPFEGGMRLRQTLGVPVSDDFVLATGTRRHIPNFTLYLYEIEDVNLGQYSPTEIRVIPTASAMLEALADPALDLARTAIVPEAVDADADLVPAKLGRFTVDRGYFTVHASSQGPSVLILPMEFSHCLHLSERTGGGPEPRLFRADLLMTGILFDRHLDATIKYRTGPFGNALCRLQDSNDMGRIRIPNAFDNRPKLRP